MAIVQTLRVGRTARHILRGEVTGVPERTRPQEVADLLTAAGHAPTEAGIAWANHAVQAVEKVPALERLTGVSTPAWTWAELVEASTRPATRQLNVRIPRALHAACEQAAMSSGLKLRPWVEKALVEALGRMSDV